MLKALGEPVSAAALPRQRLHRRRATAAVIAAAVVAGGLLVARAPVQAAAPCDRSANPSTLVSQVVSAALGQTICLGAGDYGTWQGTNKSVTLRAEPGVSATMRINIGSGDAGFTLDGLSGMGGIVKSGARDFAIRNSTFTSSLDLQGSPGSNIVIEGNRFDWPAQYSGGINAKLFIWAANYGQSSGATIRNNTFRNGDLDGIHIGNAAGADILGNTFDNLCASGSNHTDHLQTEGMVGGRIAGNLFRAGLSCAAQALTSYDGGTRGVIIEDNVIDVRRPWGIEWYADRDSIIRHNTVVYYPDSQCNFNITCGRIDVNRKSQDSAGSGTQVYDNLTTGVGFSNGSTGTQHHNVSSQGALYVGPLNTWSGFKLQAGSVGRGAASDGLDAGIRVGGGSNPPPLTTTPPPPPPTATPTTPPPSDQQAEAIWTVPTDVTVGELVTLDGTRSRGNQPVSCTWSFENQSGSIIWETLSGCELEKRFRVADTKYVELIVRDADGDTDSERKSFPVSQP